MTARTNAATNTTDAAVAKRRCQGCDLDFVFDTVAKCLICSLMLCDSCYDDDTECRDAEDGNPLRRYNL